MKAWGLLLALLLLLTGCKEGDDLITEKEALSIAQKSVQDSKVTWSARFKEDEEIEINNVKEKHKVWIIEAEFPSGNKEIYRIDAKEGKILVLTEQEVSGIDAPAPQKSLESIDTTRPPVSGTKEGLASEEQGPAGGTSTAGTAGTGTQSAISTTVKPTESPSPALTLNPTVEEFKKKGYKVEEPHVFTKTFEGIGELTVTPVTTFGIGKDFPVSLVLTGGKEDIVLTSARTGGHPMFSSFEAIAFRDIDSDGPSVGFTDIVVIVNFVTGVGNEGVIPFSDVILFRNNAQGKFVEDPQLGEKIVRSMDSRTLTMKQVMDGVKPLEIQRFIGDFSSTRGNEYYGSDIRITANDGKALQFDLQAFKFIGGVEEIARGNVHFGDIEDGIAEISGDKAVYKSNSKNSDFTITFEFFPNDTFYITERGQSEFGANVYASGLYRKK